MQRFGILGTLLLVSCGGHLDLGKDASGGTGGTNAMATTGGTGASEDPGIGSTKATGGKAPAAEGGVSSASGGSPITGGKASTGGSVAATGGASGSSPGARCAEPKSVGATGTWTGYSEDFLFKPIDKYQVEIAGVDAMGSLCGSVTFGEADPLPPATDPEAAYPPGSDPTLLKGSGLQDLWPGATYSITDGVQRDAVVRFRVSSQEVMNGWCSLQTSYTIGVDGQDHFCLPERGFGVGFEPSGMTTTCSVTSADGTQFTTTGARCYQCMSSCVCSESGCTSNMDNPITFDLTLSQDGNELIGTVGSTSLRLARVQ